MSGQKFLNFGAHCDSYPCNYLTAAAAIGMTKNDVDLFITRLDQVLKKSKKTNIPKPVDTESDAFGPFTSESGEEASDLSTITATVKSMQSEKRDSTITVTAKSESSAKLNPAISATAKDSTSSATAATAMPHSTPDTGDDDILQLGGDISSLKKAMGISHDKKLVKKELIGGSGSKHNNDDDDLLVV